MTSGRIYQISCTAWGSNPPARIEWYRGFQQDLKPIKAFNSSVHSGGNVTISWIRYVPEPSHHHQTLTCRATNENLGLTTSIQTVEDYHRLEIYCESTN